MSKNMLTPLVHAVLFLRLPAWRACKSSAVFKAGSVRAGAPRQAAWPRRHAAGAGRHPAHRRHGGRLRLAWQGPCPIFAWKAAGLRQGSRCLVRVSSAASGIAVVSGCWDSRKLWLAACKPGLLLLTFMLGCCRLGRLQSRQARWRQRRPRWQSRWWASTRCPPRAMSSTSAQTKPWHARPLRSQRTHRCPDRSLCCPQHGGRCLPCLLCAAAAAAATTVYPVFHKSAFRVRL